MKRSTEAIREKLIKLKNKGYRVVLYRNHCSPPELISFVKAIRAKHTVLLRPQIPEASFVERKKDLNFWAHLGNINRIFEFLDTLQRETEHKMEISDIAAVDAEITPQSSVDCVAMEGKFSTEMKNKNDCSENSKECELVNKNETKELSVEESLILIESDVESVASKPTILYTALPQI